MKLSDEELRDQFEREVELFNYNYWCRTMKKFPVNEAQLLVLYKRILKLEAMASLLREENHGPTSS